MPVIITTSVPGGTVTQHIPTNAWKPATATDAELAYYNIPARPRDPAGLKAWRDEWVNHFSKIGRSELCAGSPSGIRFTTFSNYNYSWAGLLDQNSGSYTEAYGHIDEPSNLLSLCGATYYIWDAWTGLGGYNIAQLAQNGIAVGAGGPPSAGTHEAWWEALDAAHPNNPPQFLNAFINGGDSVNFSTTWSSSGTLDYGWHDLTNGVVRSISQSGLFYGDPPSSYYNGATADWITELTLNSPIQLYDFGSVAWSSVKASVNHGSLNAAGGYPHIGLYIGDGVTYGNGPNPYEVAGLNPDSMSSSSSFTQSWLQCSSR